MTEYIKEVKDLEFKIESIKLNNNFKNIILIFLGNNQSFYLFNKIYFCHFFSFYVIGHKKRF